MIRGNFGAIFSGAFVGNSFRSIMIAVDGDDEGTPPIPPPAGPPDEPSEPEPPIHTELGLAFAFVA